MDGQGMFGNMYPLVISHSHGIDGPFIDGLPIKNDDFPWLC
jgi:hypothetical protein